MTNREQFFYQFQNVIEVINLYELIGLNGGVVDQCMINEAREELERLQKVVEQNYDMVRFNGLLDEVN